MIDFTAIMSVTKINPTTELALFWRRVTILGFIYIYGYTIVSSHTGARLWYVTVYTTHQDLVVALVGSVGYTIVGSHTGWILVHYSLWLENHPHESQLEAEEYQWVDPLKRRTDIFIKNIVCNWWIHWKGEQEKQTNEHFSEVKYFQV